MKYFNYFYKRIIGNNSIVFIIIMSQLICFHIEPYTCFILYYMQFFK